MVPQRSFRHLEQKIEELLEEEPEVENSKKIFQFFFNFFEILKFLGRFLVGVAGSYVSCSRRLRSCQIFSFSTRK
jgi:hypothetical protein